MWAPPRAETASHVFKAFLGFNNRPWARRGWGIAEGALALEIDSRARQFYRLEAHSRSGQDPLRRPSGHRQPEAQKRDGVILPRGPQAAASG